ncbi:hypothetical protein IEO21_00861 [Rhodonia placenta]|uniref:Fungal lipase-type domain-containing protein n=1 Tax=Rhodonia placenta TaxID=104341 RepID=A0A8H7PB13_9APHY|nr:hypothetical protein IEO21_00861 [Postia placenta]
MSQSSVGKGQPEEGPMSTGPTLPSELVLLIFIHGFKGTDHTFGDFPERLQHILSETLDNVRVQSVVFPAYEVSLHTEAVVRFADWLTTLTVQREVANDLEGGAGKAKVVLCGHSMGGLLAADTVLEFARTRPDKKAPLWPNIVACLAFDTPYLGLHPFVFKNRATQAVSYVQNAFSSYQSFTSKSTTSGAATVGVAPPPPVQAPASTSAWQKWAPAAYAVGGALIAGAAAGTAYYKREDLGVGYKWATDHMKYVGTLWDKHALERRLQSLLEIEEQMGVLFCTFYTYLPPSPPTYASSRTFIILPKAPSQLADHFVRAPNTLAFDEVQAHTGMFDIKTNDGYYDLGMSTAQYIREAVLLRKDLTVQPTKEPNQSQAITTIHPEQLHSDSTGPSEEAEDLLLD